MPTVGIVGVGLIGRAWANVFARAGWDVRLWDPDAAALAAAPADRAARCRTWRAMAWRKDPAAAAKRVTVRRSLEEAVAGAELVQESGPERLEVKREVFARLDAAAPADAILASSSSSIVTSRFAEKLKGRARCLVAHPVNPPHVVPIVELSGAPWTSPETIARARAIFESVGQVPIVVKRRSTASSSTACRRCCCRRPCGWSARATSRPRTSTRPSATASACAGPSWARSRPSSSTRRAASPTTARATARRSIALPPTPVTPERVGQGERGRAVESWGRAPSPEAILEKQRWRDERIAALVAHKKSQPKSK